MRILVTGGAGMIGSHLVRALLDLKHEVTVLDDLSSASGFPIDKRSHFIEGSVEWNDAFDKAFSSKPQVVFHLAALFANQNSVEHPQRDLVMNGLGTLKALEYSQKNGVQKFIFFSSSCVYGPQREEMSESTTGFFPETPYAVTKLLGENYCRFWSAHHKLSTVILRVFNTYGPGELPGKYRNVIPNFFKLAIESKPLPITGTGNETRSFLYVEDTVRAALMAMTRDTQAGEVFNVGSDVETRIGDLARQINAIAGNTAGIEYRPPRAWDHVVNRKASTRLARERLGFEPTISLEAGLKKTYEWLIDYEKSSPAFLRVPSASGTRSLPLS